MQKQEDFFFRGQICSLHNNLSIEFAIAKEDALVSGLTWQTLGMMRGKSLKASWDTDGTNPPTILVLYPVTIPEPAAVPAFGAGGVSIPGILGWLLALSRNKMTQTATTTTLRNDADNATIATSATSDDGTTFTRAKWA
jgi:hypothetical protein